MELLSQHAKKIMERCKGRAKEHGLDFDKNTLEFITSNRDLIEIESKFMIPTLYDYWYHDLNAYKRQKIYEIYPNNPYETVINTRPAISFYNDDNSDWLNSMIFYHVLAHIDFFQNNQFFRHTWNYDFLAKALSGKRIISALRSEHGRWVDYVIEFGRSIDNLVNFHKELDRLAPAAGEDEKRIDYFYNFFIQSRERADDRQETSLTVYQRWLDSEERIRAENPRYYRMEFLKKIRGAFPEFEEKYRKWDKKRKKPSVDLLEFIMNNSEKLNREENQWMLEVLRVIRETSLFFQPQIRTKIMNEGWASYWHEKLFLSDKYIRGHEADYAKLQSSIISIPRLGVNPYAVGLKLFSYIEDKAQKGRLSWEFDSLSDIFGRQKYNKKTGKGKEAIFNIRSNYSDTTFISSFVDQDFVSQNELFVVGTRINKERMTEEYYVKSKRAEDYRDFLLSTLYHPPEIKFFRRKRDGVLLLGHTLEFKPLVREYINNVLIGLEFLWGKGVVLTTYEPEINQKIMEVNLLGQASPSPEKDVKWRKVQYTIKNKVLKKNKKGISRRRAPQ